MPSQGLLQVYQLDLRESLPVSRLEKALTAAELSRADRFLQEADRMRFVCARGALREILADYIGCSAGAVPLTTAAHGKPVLDAAATPSVEFNVSHSGDLILIVFAQGPVGVDVELVQPIAEMDDIVETQFSDAESNWLATLHGLSRVRGFFQCWVRKEAILKGEGMGLTGSLQALDTTERHGDGYVRCALRPGAPFWTVISLAIPNSYVAAVATQERRPAIQSCTYR